MNQIIYDFEISCNEKEIENYINEVIEFALKYLNFDYDVQISVIITDDENIKKLNKQYRNKDVETDVLSFCLIDFQEGIKETDFDDKKLMLGDIVISLDKAKKQAIEYGHSKKREICFLALHGLLHLLGYDHEGDDNKMLLLQEKILHKIGIERD